jgi:glutathione synthase/RimK-type ligase-like ATP-grasp enzyme
MCCTNSQSDTRSHRFVLKRTGGGGIDLSTVGAVWWRRLQPFRLPVALTDPVHCRLAMSEAETAFRGLYQAMNTFWVNDPVLDAAAHHKPFQLALAQEVGLTIPTTLMTNYPEEARDFWRRHRGNVIYKMFIALPEAWRETRRLRSDETALAEAVRTTPVIFQSYIEAVADVRVTIIGDEIFAASTDVRKGEYPIDFQMNLDARFETHELPSEVQDTLRLLTRRLGLEYGAVDVRLTPEGSYVFLEINPAGQFLWIEMATGQKIAAALAAHLARGGNMRRSVVRRESLRREGTTAVPRAQPHLVGGEGEECS